MVSVRENHENAMKYAQMALVARENNDYDSAIDMSLKALQYELSAVKLVPEGRESEPTRSILFNSAASLAYQSKQYKTAIQLIANGLSGFPSSEIQSEFMQLLELINFEENLARHETLLETTDLQLDLYGNAIAPGMVFFDDLIGRLSTTNDLIMRTTQRLMGREYQQRGVVASVFKQFQSIVKAPTQGSFHIIIKLARNEKESLQTTFMVTAEQVIDNILTGFNLINNNDLAGLRDLINDETYTRNFIMAAKEMAPDGERVSLVGFSSYEKKVRFTTEKTKIKLPPSPELEISNSKEPRSIIGKLDFATSRKNIIGITTSDNQHHDIKISEGLDDLVKKYFDEIVEVSGIWDGSSLFLTDIEKFENL